MRNVAIHPRHCPPGPKRDYPGAHTLWRHSCSTPVEVFGYLSDATGEFIELARGKRDPSAPSVDRAWPSTELRSYVHRVAAHTHPWNASRPFDPPTVTDVCVFLLFHLTTDARREVHCVFTPSCIYTIHASEDNAHSDHYRQLCSEGVQSCELDLFKVIRSHVVRSVEEPMRRAFGREGFIRVDTMEDARRFGPMQSKKKLLAYLKIMQLAGVRISCEFINV